MTQVACREAVLRLEPPTELLKALDGVLTLQGLTLGEAESNAYLLSCHIYSTWATGFT